MAYFWLNQRDETQEYSDVEGEVYHYRSNVPGHKKLSVGDYFVYYRPADYVIFGAGTIGEIETKEINPGQETGMLTDYYAHIVSYVNFDPALQVREIKNCLSFLKDRDGSQIPTGATAIYSSLPASIQKFVHNPGNLMPTGLEWGRVRKYV